MKKRIVLAICCSLMLALGAQAQKIQSTFWNCPFGSTAQIVYDALLEQEIEPIVTDDGLYIKDNRIFGVSFSTIGLKFTESDEFYNVFGYNKYQSKSDATNAFNDALAILKNDYPNIQQMAKPEGCLRFYAYTDDGHENVFSFGLYKGNNGVFFVRINIYSDYLLKRKK